MLHFDVVWRAFWYITAWCSPSLWQKLDFRLQGFWWWNWLYEMYLLFISLFNFNHLSKWHAPVQWRLRSYNQTLSVARFSSNGNTVLPSPLLFCPVNSSQLGLYVLENFPQHYSCVNFLINQKLVLVLLALFNEFAIIAMCGDTTEISRNLDYLYQ